MRTTIAAATFVALGAGSAGLSALDMRGSDTLREITLDVLAVCANTTNIHYVGTGSSNGQGDLLSGGTGVNAGTLVAPMSRFMNSNTCNYPSASPATAKNASLAEGLVFALDGLSIVAASADAGTCNGGAVDCTAAADDRGMIRGGTIPGTAYTLGATAGVPAWADALRIIFGGWEGGDGVSGSSPISNRDCGGATRAALINSYTNMFEGGCTGCGTNGLRHAFRRDDESGTTDAFLAILQMPSVNLQTGASVFCNAQFPVPSPLKPAYPEFQDKDPIRRTCIATYNLPQLNPGGEPANVPAEQVCGVDGMLGVVLPINPPPQNSTTTPVVYPTAPCAFGVFGLGAAPANGPFPSFGRCPNGDLPVGIGQCLVPTTVSGSFHCLSGKNNRPLFVADTDPAVVAVASNADGRVYNQTLRKADGSLATIKRPGPVLGGPAVDADIVGAFYRLHTTRPGRTGGVLCTEPDATQQLGCLAVTNPCSIAYAGREAIQQPGSLALKINGLEPTDSCVRNLLTAPSTAYPISRKLYLNTMAGFEVVAGSAAGTIGEEQWNLTKCFADEAVIDPIVAANGFITLGQNVFCEDFNQGSCPSSQNHPATPANACSNNPAAILP
jgi:hypothetical protein